MRGQLRGLEHDRIASGQGADQRAEGELEGKIPRCHDQAGALGFVADLAEGAEQGLGGGHPPRFHPAFELLHGVIGFGDHHHDFGQLDLDFGLAEIGVNGLGDIVAARPHRVAQAGDPGAAFGGRGAAPFQGPCLLQRKHAAHVGLDRRDVGVLMNGLDFCGHADSPGSFSNHIIIGPAGGERIDEGSQVFDR